MYAGDKRIVTGLMDGLCAFGLCLSVVDLRLLGATITILGWDECKLGRPQTARS